jgi:hypothetical protein
MDTAVKSVQTGRERRRHVLTYSVPLTALSVTPSREILDDPHLTVLINKLKRS